MYADKFEQTHGEDFGYTKEKRFVEIHPRKSALMCG
jgi:hypothetical protein